MANVTLITGDDGSNVRVGGAGSDLIYGFDPNGPQGQVTSISATRVASLPETSVFAESPPGDTGRLFIVQLAGNVRILDLATGQLLPTPFLDIASSIGVVGEGGLIGFTFDPDYATNGYVYVSVTNPSIDSEIRRYQVSASDPNRIDPASETLIIGIDQPAAANHKGGWIGFGPDGYLYAAFGDGGGANDQFGNGQNIDDLLGDILRLDVHGDAFPGDPTRNYAIPADNPFVGTAGADEIWAFGLRNPFRDSFDRGLGDLYIGDVGQSRFEEIDIGQIGGNYGWPLFEGFEAHAMGTPTGGSVVDPIHAYGRTVGTTVIGGYVYRGQSEGLQGDYFFADTGNGHVFTLHKTGSTWVATDRTSQITVDVGAITNPTSFGEDALGNLYIVDFDGEVFRLTPNVISADLGDDLSGLGGNDQLYGGSGDDTLRGGADDDVLNGGKGHDALMGDSGADMMVGDMGNDSYFVDQSGDVVFERPNEGNDDTVVASISYTLGINVENLVLAAGAGAINATGNSVNNVLIGNTSNNVIDGGAGNDTAVFSQSLDKYTLQDFGSRIMVSGPDGVDTLFRIEHLLFTDGTITSVDDGNTLFDTLYYFSRNPDVFHAGVNALGHFNTFGWHEGRDPNGFFSVSGYLGANKDVAASGVNPLDQYHQTGWREGRDPSLSFDTTLYLLRNPDVAASGIDPLEHYLQHGLSEGRTAFAAIGSTIVSGFDAEYYLFTNPDVARAGIDPLTHFNSIGWHEGRNPNAYFDTAGYLAHNPDVAAAGINPLQHYQADGWREGRDASVGFDTMGYLAANPDVAAAHINPLDHFLLYGIYEGRQAVNDGMWG